LWAGGGIALTSTGPSYGTAVKAISDGAGGAFVAFVNPTTLASHPVPIEVQRIGPTGALLWGQNGVSLGAMESFYNYDFDLASDGTGGVLVAWDAVVANSPTIVAQRLDANGNLLWGDGTVVTAGAANRIISDLVGDGNGGAVLIWDDARNDSSLNYQDCYNLGNECDIYAQHLGSDGSSLWNADGAPVVVAPNAQFRGQLVPSNDGSFLALWSDCRAYPESCLNNMQIYMQVLTPSGAPFGPLNGTPVSTAPWNHGTAFTEDQGWPAFARISDGLGGAILAWPDGRNMPCQFGLDSSQCDIYAQRVGVPGAAGMPSSTPTTTLTATPTATPTPVSATLSVKPAKLDLGDGFYADKAEKTGYVMIENPSNSTQPIIIESITTRPVYGDPRTGLHRSFDVPPGQCIGPLLPGAKCRLTITYAPTLPPLNPFQGQPEGGGVIIANNGASQPVIQLSGTAVEHFITYKPKSLNFGAQKYLTTGRPQSVTVTNRNTVPVNLGGVGTQGYFSITGASCYDQKSASFIAPANGSCTISVAYSPSKIGLQTGRLFVDSYTGPIYQVVPLRGVGTR